MAKSSSTILDELRRARTREALRTSPRASPRQFHTPRKALRSPLVQNCMQASLSHEVHRGCFELTSTGGLTAGLASMMCDDRFADVYFLCEGQRFPAHRVILAIWSGYFRMMFSGSWSESSSSVVEVPMDMCSVHVLKSFLKFCYTGKISRVGTQEATELLPVSSFLDIKSLEDICCSVLLREASTLDLMHMLGSASTLSARLRSLCIAQLALELGEIDANLSAISLAGSKCGIAEPAREKWRTSDRGRENREERETVREEEKKSGERREKKSSRAREQDLLRALSSLPLDCLIEVLREAATCPPGCAPRGAQLRMSVVWAEVHSGQAERRIEGQGVLDELLSVLPLEEIPAGELSDLLAARPYVLRSIQQSHRWRRTIFSSLTSSRGEREAKNKLSPLNVKSEWEGGENEAARPQVQHAFSNAQFRRPFRHHGRLLRPVLQPTTSQDSVPLPPGSDPTCEPQATLVQGERNSAATLVQARWRGFAQRGKLWSAAKCPTPEEAARRRDELRQLRACISLQAAWRGRRQRFRGSAADVVELRGIRRELAGLREDDVFTRMLMQMRETAAVQIQAAARRMLAVAAARKARADKSASDSWLCPLALCSRRGCKCIAVNTERRRSISMKQEVQAVRTWERA